MKKSILLSALFGLLFPLCAPAQEGPDAQNGSIVRTEIGFPFHSYNQWMETRRQGASFQEAEFRREYPAERFAEFKAEFQIPFDTYEEWIQVLRRRFRNAGFDEEAFRAKYSPEDFQRYEAGVEYQTILYMSDGLRVAGHILRPKNIQDEALPVIIYNRGGNRELGHIEFETLYSLFDLVLEGYVVVASQYRGCCGGEGQDELGGKDVDDVLNLIPLIESLPYADSGRIGMFGWSRGGMMTYLAAARTDRLAAAVIAAGPADLANLTSREREAERLFAEIIPDYATDREEQLRQRSALFWPERLPANTPLLLLQGAADQQTNPMDALRMAQRLQEAGRPFRLVFFEEGNHGLTQHEPEVRRLISDWFHRYLRRPGRS